MLNQLPDFLKPVVILLFIIWGTRLWLNWRKAKNDFQDVDYDEAGLKDSEKWRWTIPPADFGIKIKENENESTIVLPAKKSSMELVCTIFSLLLCLFAIFLSGTIIYRKIVQLPTMPVAGIVMVLLILALAWALTNVNAPLTAISKTSDSIILTQRQAYINQRRLRIELPSHTVGSFSGKLQSFYAMDIDQLDELPDFYLIYKQPWRTDKRFIMRVKPDLAGWIVKGLNQSLNRAGTKS